MYMSSDKGRRLFHMGSKSLKNLPRVSMQLKSQREQCFWLVTTHLQLNLSLSNILLASAAAGNLLGLGNTSSDRLGAEVLQGVTLDRVDAHGRVGLNCGEPTSDYNSLLAHVLTPTYWTNALRPVCINIDEERGATYGRIA